MVTARGVQFALAGPLLIAATTLCACAVTPSSAATAAVTVTAAATLTPIQDPLARIHNATERDIPLFVSITFTNTTSYKDANALLRKGPSPTGADPWGCDAPRSITPPPLATQESAYSASHALLITYATWDELVWLANSPLVASINGIGIPLCP